MNIAAIYGATCDPNEQEARAMAEIVNLRMARKRKARAEKEAAAAENRARHGRSKAEKALDAAREDMARREVDAHRRERPPEEE